MDREIFTVDEVAVILDMHPKTIRRYINEGKLKGVKVGGQFRVMADALKAFMNLKNVEEKVRLNTETQLDAFINGSNSILEGKIQICCVVDVHAKASEEIMPITQGLIEIINGSDFSEGKARFQYSYYKEAEKGRFTLWGSPDFIEKMMSFLGEYTKKGEE